jgi:uncharacterized RDD family membrane protein YckC
VSAIDTTTTVETPERVGFRHRLAGPGPRGLAWAVDLALQGVLLLIVAVALASVGFGTDGLAETSAGVLYLAIFVVSWFYAAAFEWAWAGRTPGKALLGLRVVRHDGGPVELRDAVLRNLLRGVDGLPVGYVVAVIAVVLDPKLRRLGDLVAGTLVVAEHRPELLDGIGVDPPVSEVERQALPVAVALTRAERTSIEGLLRRRGQLHPERVEELAGRLAPAVRARHGVEAPTSLRTLELAWARATGRDR